MSYGCGPSNWPKKLRALLFGWWFNDPCTRHDGNYSTGGKEADRLFADWLFLLDMMSNVARLNPWLWAPAFLVACTFFIIVLMFGWTRFNYR